MPVFARKRESYRAVKEKAEKSGLTFTLIACGAFLDWCLSTGFAGIQLKTKTATMFDSGENVVPWTTLEDAGKATAGALLRPEETLNRPMYVHSAFLSQAQLLQIAKDALGKEGWNIASQEMKPLLDQSMADLRAGNITPMTFGVQFNIVLPTHHLHILRNGTIMSWLGLKRKQLKNYRPWSVGLILCERARDYLDIIPSQS
jgi:hypothetical protein